MDLIWENIKQIAEDNHGLIKTSQVELAGISRPMLKKYKDKGDLQCVRKGLYALTDTILDDYLLIQVQKEEAVFSYGTALYLWGLSDRTPHYMDVTVPRGANCSRLKRDNPHIRFHYVNESVYDLGVCEMNSPQGNKIKVYDKERCICDIIRNKELMDLQIFSQAIKEYFKSKPNLRRLIKYSKRFDIEESVRTYMEVL